MAMSFLLAETTDAQILKFGLTAGANINQMKFDEKVIDEKNFNGFFIGPTLDVKIPVVGLSADASLLYDHKSVNVNGQDDHIDYIDLPINAKYSIGLGKLLSVYLATGPQFSFNVGDGKILDKKYDLKSSVFSWNFGAGVKILKHFQVGYRYNLGISDTAEKATISGGIKSIKDKSGTHQLGLTYYF